MKRTILSLLFGTASMFTMAQNQTVSHVVQRGETLESIAEYYNVSVEDIDKANPNMDGVVYVGLKLNLPIKTTQTSTPTIVQQDNKNKAATTPPVALHSQKPANSHYTIHTTYNKNIGNLRALQV